MILHNKAIKHEHKSLNHEWGALNSPNAKSAAASFYVSLLLLLVFLSLFL